MPAPGDDETVDKPWVEACGASAPANLYARSAPSDPKWMYSCNCPPCWFLLIYITTFSACEDYVPCHVTDSTAFPPNDCTAPTGTDQVGTCEGRAPHDVDNYQGLIKMGGEPLKQHRRYAVMYSVRSDSPVGTALEIPVALVYQKRDDPSYPCNGHYSGGSVGENSTSVTWEETLHFTVGAKKYIAEGEAPSPNPWDDPITFDHDGVPILVYVARFFLDKNAPEIRDNPAARLEYCDISEYALPLFDVGGNPMCATGSVFHPDHFENPGPVKAIDLLTKITTAARASYPSEAMYDFVKPYGEGWRHFVECYENEGPPYDATEGLYEGSGSSIGQTSSGSHGYSLALCDETPVDTTVDCRLNVGWHPTGSPVANKKLWFGKADFDTPASPITTDDTMTIDLLFKDPWTGREIDGTKTVCDNTGYADVDSIPEIEMVPITLPQDASETISRTITRNAYGDYSLTSTRFKVKAGTRRFRIYPNFERTTLKPVTKYKVESNDITINPGAAAYLDLVPIDWEFDPVPIQIGAAFTYDPATWGASPYTPMGQGDALVARILDAVGQFEVFNVNTSATNTPRLTLTDGGGNGIAAANRALLGTGSSGTGASTQIERAAVAGIVTYTGNNAYALGRNYTLKLVAGTSGLTVSSNFNWREFDVEFWVGLRINDPGAVTAGVNFNLTCDLVDASGNIVSPDTIDNLTTSGGGSFTGYGTAAPVAGTLTQNGNFPAAGTYTVQVVTSGTTYDGPPTTVTRQIVVSP